MAALLMAALGCTAGPVGAPAASERVATSALPQRYDRDRRAAHDALLAYEATLTREPLRYASKRRSERFYPDGLYVEPAGQRVWVWSRAHTEQRGFAWRAGAWHLVETRSGPLDTRRCVALRSLTLCLGLLHPGGLHSHGAAFTSGLPGRSGFRDFVAIEARGRIYVIDAYRDALWTLDMTGAVLDQTALVPGAYRIGALGDDHLFVLASNQPHFSVIPLDAAGAPATPVAIETAATIRDAVFDPQHRVLWTAGYRQARVRRSRGYIENLESFIYAYRAEDVRQGRFEAIRGFDLSRHGLADPTGLIVDESGVIAAVSGSHALIRLDRDPRSTAPIAIQPSAFVVNAVAVASGQLIAAGFLDGQLRVHARKDLAPRPAIALAKPLRDAELTPYQLGEVLFYSKALWADTPGNQFTCNTCHWDGLTDYRVHPGFKESRFEQIRPARGAGMLSPIFSPGQSANLTVAVNAFIRTLDRRYWLDTSSAAWLDDVVMDVMPGVRRVVSADDVRRGLIAYLARLPVEPGMLRAPGQPLSASAQRGAELVWRDCVTCHVPAPHTATGAPLSREDALAYLIDRPLAFGAARLEQTGVEPYFTERGNRVSPLIQLSRGGPFFTNSAAPTLADVLRQTNPRADQVHAPDNARAPYYSPDDAQAVIDFLLSI